MSAVQNIVLSNPPSWVFGNATADLDFQNSRYFVQGLGNTIDGGFTFARASVAYMDDLSGNYFLVPSGVPRISNKGFLNEQSRTNSIRNNSMQGAVIGTPGTIPTNWITGTLSGTVTLAVAALGTENGIDYVDISVVITGASSFFLQTEAVNQMAASNAQAWASSAFVKLSAGTLTNVSSVDIRCEERNAGGTFLASTNTAFTPTSASLSSQRQSAIRTLNQATTAFVEQSFVVSTTGDATFTLRFGWPQMELASQLFVTSPIRTTNAAVTRAGENLYLNTLLPWFNPYAYTCLLDFSRITSSSNGNQSLFALTDNSTGNFVNYFDLNSSRLEIAPYVQNLQGFITGIGGTGNNKVALGGESQGTANWTVNGGALVTGNSQGAWAPMNAVTRFVIGSERALTPGNLYIRRVTYFPKMLSGADMRRLTT